MTSIQILKQFFTKNLLLKKKFPNLNTVWQILFLSLFIAAITAFTSPFVNKTFKSFSFSSKTENSFSQNKAVQNYFPASFSNPFLNPPSKAEIYRLMCLPDDSLALVELYNATDGANWTNPWTLTDPWTTWAGVVLNANDSCVLELNLSNRNLTGTIPTSMFGGEKLNQIQAFNLADNNLTGEIPAEFNTLLTLEELNLSNNNLTGEIPASLADLLSLRALQIGFNSLTGNFPIELTDIATLSNLEVITIDSNFIENVPTFSVNRPILINIANNRLKLNSIVPNNKSQYTFDYSPQDSIGDFKIINVPQGGTFRDTVSVNQINGTTTYRWFRAADLVNEQTDDSVLVVDNATIADHEGIYTAEITHTGAPDITLNRKRFFVNVIECPSNNLITTPDTTICEGQNLPTLVGSEAILGEVSFFSYQWQQTLNGDTTSWTDASNGNVPNYALNNFGLTLSDTAYFRRIVIPAPNQGCSNDTSLKVMVVTLPNVTQNTLFPSIQNVCLGVVPTDIYGSTSDSSATSLLRYRYQVSLDSGMTWIDSLQTQNFAFTDTLATADTVQFRRIVTGACAPDTSNVITINSIPRVVADSIFESQTICINTQPDTIRGDMPIGGDRVYKYIWQIATRLDTADWLSVDSTLNRFVPPVANDTFYVRRVVESACFADTSNIVDIFISPDLGNDTSAITATRTRICVGDPIAAINGTAPVAPTGFRYLWEVSLDSSVWTSVDSAQNYIPRDSLLFDTIFMQVPDSFLVRRSVIDSCRAYPSNVVKLFMIKPIDSATNLISYDSTGFCATDTTFNWTIDVTEPTGGTGNYTYQWQISFDSTRWADRDDSVRISAFDLTESTYFRRLVIDSCSTDTSNVAFIPVINSFGLNEISVPFTDICTTDSATITISGTNPESTGEYSYFYQQSRDTIAWFSSSTFTFSTGTFTQSQTFVPDTLFGGSNYFRRVVLGGCKTDTSNRVFVNVVSAIRDNSISENFAGQSLCEGDTAWTIDATQPTGGTSRYSYQWQISFDSLAWANRDDSLNISNFALTEPTYFRRLVIDSCNTDTSNVVFIPVAKPFGVNQINAPFTEICIGDSTTITLTGTEQENTGEYKYFYEQSRDTISWFSSSTFTFSTGNFTQTQTFVPDTLFGGSNYFRRVILGGCQPDTSNRLLVNVVLNARNNFLFGGQTICQGDTASTITATQAVAGQAGNIITQWEVSFDSLIWVPTETDTVIAYEPVTPQRTTYVRRSVKSGNCPPDYSNVIKIEVIRFIENNEISTPQTTVCEGFAADTLRGTFPTQGGNDSTAYRFIWQSRKLNDSTANWRTVGGDQDYFTGAVNFDTEYRRLVRVSCFNDTSNVVSIRINPTIKNNIIDEGFVDCSLDTLSRLTGTVLLDTLNDIGQFRYQWQNSRNQRNWTDIANTNTASYLPTPIDTTTFYRRLVINDCFTDSSNIAEITIRPAPILEITPDTTINIGYEVQLFVNGAINYLWTPDPTLTGDSTSTPTVKPTISTMYTVRAENIYGCFTYDSVFVTVIGTPKVRTVDVITPDGNGLNDQLYIEEIERYPDNELVIINRWGQEVYRKKGYNNDWEGANETGGILPAGTYFYIIKFESVKTILKGSFEIIR
ncbi:gliding motility-associated C-terminal domain-containing protein [Bernardetia sp. ABR2-2B]|uniref:gliding motility-associated C-terminal domain-containing protein n=1 Tax=Bernardetia sp. ABR2-2B TaxID=3127472 RepID=UPI0030CB6D35